MKNWAFTIVLCRLTREPCLQAVPGMSSDLLLATSSISRDDMELCWQLVENGFGQPFELETALA